MFRKIALISALALSSQLQVYAAGCDLPQAHPDWHPDWGDWETKFCEPSEVPNSICVVKWKGLGWWSNFHANNHNNDGFFESEQAYAPQNVKVTDKGLELKVRKLDLGGGETWAAAEAVLVADKDGRPMNIGYGDYLFTVENPVPIKDMDRAMVFGAFTYLRGGDDGIPNPRKELDMVEISKWGWTGQGDCPWPDSNPMSKYGCFGSFQMGSQPWEQEGTLKRFPVDKNAPDLDDTTLTFYMHWEDARTPVQYKAFKGIVDMNTAKTKDGDLANFKMEQTQYVPVPDQCVRFHFNFYRAVYSKGRQGINLEPKNAETVIYVTNFEYQPKK